MPLGSKNVRFLLIPCQLKTIVCLVSVNDIWVTKYDTLVSVDVTSVEEYNMFSFCECHVGRKYNMFGFRECHLCRNHYMFGFHEYHLNRTSHFVWCLWMSHLHILSFRECPFGWNIACFVSINFTPVKSSYSWCMWIALGSKHYILHFCDVITSKSIYCEWDSDRNIIYLCFCECHSCRNII